MSGLSPLGGQPPGGGVGPYLSLKDSIGNVTE